MSAFSPIPLGQRIPASAHAVSCSLPTMAAVRGYEEKNPEIMRHLTSGYPRFVVHPYIQTLARLIGEEHGLAGHTVWLTSSARMAGELAAHLAGSPVPIIPLAAGGRDRRPIHGVAHPAHSDVGARAKVFLQNVGGFTSSRLAEDELLLRGLLPARQSEARRDPATAAAEIRRHLDPLFPGAGEAGTFFANSGANAIYAAFRAAASIQAARGRTVWVQLGWLYLDTIAVLRKFTASPTDYVYLGDVFDRAAWEKLFADRGATVAGIVIEAPTNPLVQMPDLEALTALARRHGALCLVDPTINSALNLDVFRHADVIVTSLTKYAASEGDVNAGLAVVNPSSPDAPALRLRIATTIEPLDPPNLARLAAEIGDMARVVEISNASTEKVARFLESHPGVSAVHWALHPSSRAHYLRAARHPRAVGSMISFSVRGPLEGFYDRLRLPKGPSFGMKTTLICPFMYLAHYELVTSATGRAELAASGLDPELLRLSVGIEPVEDIIGALDEALQ